MKANEVTVWLDIAPQPQERIRFKFKGWGKRRTITPYLPEKTREFQDSIRCMIREYMDTYGISEFNKLEALELETIFYVSRPKSASTRLAPTVRPDLSNYLKAVEDGLQRESKQGQPALMEDDSAICSIKCQKRYVDDEYQTPGILVTLRNWSPHE